MKQLSLSKTRSGFANAKPLRIIELQKSYGRFVAIQEVSFQIAPGQLVTLLGPSGCGKTTIMRLIAGLEIPDAGEIWLGPSRLDKLPIERRNVGLVFQNYALFPHRTVAANIAYGLHCRGIAKADVRKRVLRTLDLVRLAQIEEKYPRQLSGGQQQRVALARAIVIEPDVLLLDEPLSALDANLRIAMREEICALQRELGITTVFVTHDQDEALAISDTVVVMNEGTVEQVGTPVDLYDRPGTEFVAHFLGRANILPAVVEESADGELLLRLGESVVVRTSSNDVYSCGVQISIAVRQHRLSLFAAETGCDGVNGVRIPGRVLEIQFLGSQVHYAVETALGVLRVIHP
ncbi:MAG: ABC transporter ATP-binding protein, partial [Lysobacterales bacterium]